MLLYLKMMKASVCNLFYFNLSYCCIEILKTSRNFVVCVFNFYSYVRDLLTLLPTNPNRIFQRKIFLMLISLKRFNQSREFENPGCFFMLIVFVMNFFTLFLREVCIFRIKQLEIYKYFF